MSRRTFVFNFQPQFAEAVAAGVKRQTIRKWRRDGKVPKPGDRVKCYRGLRQRGPTLLYDGLVVECFQVMITYGEPRPFTVNGVLLHPGEADAFARLDGFQSAAELLAFFKATHRGENFDGFCVRWRTDEH